MLLQMILKRYVPPSLNDSFDVTLKAPFREALSAVIKGGCHAAIWISKRF